MLPFIVTHYQIFDEASSRIGGGGQDRRQHAARPPSLSAVAIAELHRLYLWATSVVAAYSFELGEERFQVCF